MKKFVLAEPGAAEAILALLLVMAILTGLGLFAWWAFSWTTHTIVWFIFIFGSVLGAVRVRPTK